MYTFCPTCSTIFSIKAEHLLAADGRVRCGECGQVFRAFDFVYEELEAAQAAQADFYAPKSAAYINDEWQAGHGGAGSDVDGDDGYAFDGDAAVLIDPVYAGVWPDRSNFWRNAGYGGLIGALLLLFALQWLYFNRAELAADNDWRPGLEGLCSLLHCNLPLQVDLSRIELINRDVRRHPRVAGALLINATLVNHAGFTQPYPILAVTFSNSTGTPVAARRFKPAEYLGKQVDVEAGMPPDTPVQVVLEIEDPGEEAVSFQFDFL
jgi:predicted Zn finger-like uncharacterized protein